MRKAEAERKTKETEIKISLDLDGSGESHIDSGIGFFDHMLACFSKHGFFDLKLSCKGDLNVDGHHTVEDCGLVLGEAINKALGDKKGIRRYGHFVLPMDDALVLAAVDLSGRPYLNYSLKYTSERCGELELSLIKEFFQALANSAGMNIHIMALSGENDHHIAEAAFKSFGKALDMAVGFDERIDGILSTKGKL